MKKIYTLIALAIFSLGAFAQVPQKMSYQAVIRNASGNLVVSSSIGMEIVIINEDVSSPVYAETHTATTNANGLVSVQLGSGAAFFGSFTTIDWSTGNYSVQVGTDVTGGTSYSISGTSQLLSVPYAMYAGSAGGGLGDGSATGISPFWNGTTWVTNNTNFYNNGGNIGLNTTTPTAQLELGDIYAAGGKNLQIGDDTYLSDIDVPNVLGIYGVQNSDRAALKLGSSGPELWGRNNNIGIGNNNPTAKLDVAGNVKISDGTQGAGKVLTSDANGLATWSNPSNNAPYYHFTGTAFGQQISFPVGNWGAIITVAIRENCVSSKTAGGMIYYDAKDNIVSIINTTAPSTGSPASITASGNVLSLSNGCVPETFTFTVSSGVVTITVGGDPGGIIESKWIVLGI
jgi:hypothetical protein